MTMPGYDSFMNPGTRPEDKKRLEPGDRLADGTVWEGSGHIDRLKARQAQLEQQVSGLQQELMQIEAELEVARKAMKSKSPSEEAAPASPSEEAVKPFNQPVQEKKPATKRKRKAHSA